THKLLKDTKTGDGDKVVGEGDKATGGGDKATGGGDKAAGTTDATSVADKAETSVKAAASVKQHLHDAITTGNSEIATIDAGDAKLLKGDRAGARAAGAQAKKLSDIAEAHFAAAYKIMDNKDSKGIDVEACKKQVAALQGQLDKATDEGEKTKLKEKI